MPGDGHYREEHNVDGTWSLRNMPAALYTVNSSPAPDALLPPPRWRAMFRWKRACKAGRGTLLGTGMARLSHVCPMSSVPAWWLLVCVSTLHPSWTWPALFNQELPAHKHVLCCLQASWLCPEVGPATLSTEPPKPWQNQQRSGGVINSEATALLLLVCAQKVKVKSIT
jgi:hypothetical protein